MNHTTLWHSFLERLQDNIRPESILQTWNDLASDYPDERARFDFIINLLGGLFVVPVGLAAFATSLEEAPQQLAEMAQALANLDYQTGQQRLSRKARKIYRSFVDEFAPLVNTLGQAMAKLFTCYVTDAYDLARDANELFLQAEQMAETDLEAAYNLIAQAGAMGLRGAHIWWRWAQEITPPLRLWTSIVVMLVDNLTMDGAVLWGPAAEEQQMWQEVLIEAKDTLIPSEGTGQRETTPRQVETTAAEPTKEVQDLFTALYNGPQALTPQLQKAFAAHREQVIPELIALASNEDLWPADSPGEGYVPIHAVDLLGQLQAVEAVTSLIDIVGDTETGDILRDAALNALEKIGKPAVPAFLETMRYSRDLELKATLAPTLGEIGTKQPGVFEALEQLYQQIDWDNDRGLVVMGFGSLRDKRAIPLLRPELCNPALSVVDRVELFDALKELGVQGKDMDEAWRMIIQEHISSLFDSFLGLENFRSFVAVLPPEQQRDASYVAHYFTHIAGGQVVQRIIPSLFDEPARAMDTIAALEAQVQQFDFAAGISTLKGATRHAAEHLAECAGPQLRRAMQAIVASLRAYVQDNYRSSWNPNQLLREVKQLQKKDLNAALAKLGQAGALALRGKKLWPYWATELELPSSDWVFGLYLLVSALRGYSRFPFRAFAAEAKRHAPSLPEFTVLLPKQQPELDKEQQALLREVFCGKDELRPGVIEQFRAVGKPIVPYLLDILDDPDLIPLTARGKGRAPGHAAFLLGELRASEAVEHLLAAVVRMPPDSHLAEEAALALIKLGSTALPAIEDFLRWSENEQAKAKLQQIAEAIRTDREG